MNDDLQVHQLPSNDPDHYEFQISSPTLSLRGKVTAGLPGAVPDIKEASAYPRASEAVCVTIPKTADHREVLEQARQYILDRQPESVSDPDHLPRPRGKRRK